MKFNTLPIVTRLGGGVLLAILAGLPLAASAGYPNSRAHPGFYVGGGAGLNSLEGEDYTGPSGNRVEDEKVSYKGFAGFRLNPIVSLEATYIDFGTAEGGNNRVNADGFILGGVFEAPMSPHFHPYLKAGGLLWDSNSRFGVSAPFNDDGTDFTYGVGGRLILGHNLDLRAEYERFELNLNDVNTISAMIQFNF